MIKKITLNSSEEKIKKFYDQRGSRVQFWKCLNCKKDYNSENAIRKQKGENKILGMGIFVLCCPYCNVEQLKKCEWLKSEMKYLIIGFGKNRKGYDVISSKEIKELKELK